MYKLCRRQLRQNYLFVQTKTARNHFYKQIFVDIGWLLTSTNNRKSLVGVVRLFSCARFPVARTTAIFIRATSIPVQGNVRSLVTPEIK